MFKTRLAQWGYLKKMRDVDWQAVAVLSKELQKSGRKASAFKVHRRKIKLADLKKYLKDRKMSEDDLLAEAAANDINGQNIPNHIHCFNALATAEPGSPAPNSSQDPSTSDGSPTRGHLGITHCSSTSPAVSASPSGSFDIVNKPASTSSRVSSNEMSTTLPTAGNLRSPTEHLIDGGSDFAVHGLMPLETNAPFCDQVQQEMGELLVRGLSPDSMDLSSTATAIEPWTYLNYADDTGCPSVVCSRCHTEISNHLPFSLEFLLGKENFIPRSMFFHDIHLTSPISPDADLGSVWMACCFGACIFVRQRDFDFVAKSLSQADAAFAQMLRTQNSTILTSLNSTLTILHAHDQGKMAMSVIRSALHVAQAQLGTEDPISLTIEWMVALAWKQLPQCRVKTDHLRAIYNTFGTLYGDQHPHTLGILYNLAFNLIRDKLFTEAEAHLRLLYAYSKLTLGPSHLQTITALTTLSRALQHQNKFEEAVKVRKQAVEIGRRTLGPNHPHQLESMRRLALIYETQGKDDLMEPIYWAVLKGRIKSLGPKHDFTEGAMEDLIELLKKLGKWDEGGRMKRTIDELFATAEDTSDHEAF